MIKNLFAGVKNVDFVGESFSRIVGQEVKMETVVLEELDTSRWNTLAERTNTKSFIRMVGREPVNYAEVQAWVKGLSEGIEKAAALADATAH
ncbi:MULTISPECIES: hypothetical protein [unclassified Lysinibacillus]|uniref:hypothetical protein n=1 Tax=unclassified Lysinibacillus TaxID=2636778 RepID=UPI0025A10034|nr:hypothetical protein [Lysinibacillus sp. G4S2]MDM5246218.1 hypothetical protein [Lysinibacillus sp. G4S2]